MRNSMMALIAGAALEVLNAAQPSPPMIAVLEHPQCASDPALAARPVFARIHDDWIALSTADASKAIDLRDVNWAVALGGRNLGPVHTTDPGTTISPDWYPRDRRLIVHNTPRPPSVANVRGAFAGWCSSPPTRPLVLVAPANTQDPDSWKPFAPPSSMRAKLFAAFKTSAGAAVRCPKEAKNSVPFDYTAANVVLGQSYRDRAGRMLIALQLDPRMNDCDGPGPDGWSSHWFLLADGVHALGPISELVGAGDYDGDGSSEILFWYSGYNEDGYTLFYRGFTRHASFRWNYH